MSSDIEVMNGDGMPMANGNAKDAKGKRLSVERIYQKKTQLEHILLRPDTYIGAVEATTQPMWVYEEEAGIINKEITYVPGLYKIFDEILVNAADNKQRDNTMNCIKIDIDPENNLISVWNNGKGIPVIMHREENVFIPTMIFGILLTSSNYNDDQKKVTGGRNGFGAKLCNVFSTEFTIETACGEYGKKFKQTWFNNMGKVKDPKILPHKGDDYTKVSFKPDLSKFKMDSLDKDIVSLMSKRAYDIAGCLRNVKVFLNGKRLPVKNFQDYCQQYVKDKEDDKGNPLKMAYEKVSDRWEVAFTVSDKGFQQVSFVNSIATTKGGRHIDHVSDQFIKKIAAVVTKKKKAKINIKPFQVKSHMWVFVNCLIENPMFDSQTKENMTLQVKSFGSKCDVSDKFIGQVLKCGIVESVMTWVDYKAQTQLDQKCHSKKHSKLKIAKLDDANYAGGKRSQECTLIITEGDSAKTLAVAGLGVIGRDKYGVYPLKGKMLNVREATHKQILENHEINELIKALGLQYKKKYQSIEDMKSMRYGKLMIMADQDQDGSHIKGLVINFIHHNWPSLLKLPFLEEFITPIVKVTKGSTTLPFYSIPEFNEWKAATDDWQKWKVKYYKGLGSSESSEGREYFSDMVRHRIRFKYQNEDDDGAIQLAFSKKMIEQRKEWLTNSMEERKRRRELGLPEIYLYGKETRAVTYSDFVNKELVLFSNADNERSIPSLVDGLKPGQRKVLYTCLKKYDTAQVKVVQLAGSVTEHSAYHHGDASLMGTIVNLAQNFVGSNNINLLCPMGQFGTRLKGGKDSASPRYIHTKLSPLAKHIFNKDDGPLLKYLFDDNLKIEPEYYVPIIPMVLVNGAEGIGTGWSTKIPNYNPRDIVTNIRRLLAGDEPIPMTPWFKDFKGTIDQLGTQLFLCSGEVSILSSSTVEITELPVKTWTQTYKEGVMEVMLHGSEKAKPCISDYKEYHTDTSVKFLLSMSQDQLSKFEEEGMHKALKLQTTISTTSMVLFDGSGCLRRFETVEDILREFFNVRLDFYNKRKAYMEGMLQAETDRLQNQARFILEKIEGKVVVENKKRKEIIRILEERGFDADPVRAWKKKIMKQEEQEMQQQSDAESEEEQSETAGSVDYDYLLKLSMWSLTEERKKELLKKCEQKQEELNILKRKTPSDLWTADLDKFMAELEKVETDEKAKGVTLKKPAKGALKGKKVLHVDALPSPQGQRVVPKIDAEMKKKASKAADSKEGKAKKKKEKEDKTQKKLDDVFKAMEKDEGNMSLAERLGTTPEKIEKKKKAAPKRTKITMDTSDESEDDMFQASMEDSPRIDRPKRATAAKKIKIDDSEDEWGSDDDNSDADAAPAPKKQSDFDASVSDEEDDDDDVPAPKASTNNKNGKMSDDSDFLAPSDNDSDDSFKAESKPKKKAVEKPPPKPKSTLTVKTKAAQKQMTLFDSLLGDKKDDHKFDSDSDIAEIEPSSKPEPSNKRPIASDSSDSDVPQPKKKVIDDSDDSDYAAPAKQKKAAAKKKKDSDDDLFKKKPAKKAAPKKKKVDDSDDDMFAEKPAKKAVSKKKLDSDDDDDDVLMEKPAKKAPKPKKPAAKKKKNVSSGDDDDDFGMKPAKKVTKKKASKKKNDSSDSDDFKMDASDDEEFVPRARPTGRARAPVKYQLDDESGEESF